MNGSMSSMSMEYNFRKKQSHTHLDQPCIIGDDRKLKRAMIHLESIQSLPKQIEYLDSLVEKFIYPSDENLSVASVEEREELSNILLEVFSEYLVCFQMHSLQQRR